MRAVLPLSVSSLGLAILLPIAVIGCGVHLHSPANQQVAERAQTDFQEARIGEVMNEERARLSELLGQELAAVRRLTLAHRDAAVVAVIGGSDAKNSWDAWTTNIDQRLLALLGAKPKEGYGPIIGTLAGAQFAFTEAGNALARLRRQYAAAPGGKRPDLPPCPPVLQPATPLPAAPDPPKDAIDALFGQYLTECTAYREKYAVFVGGGGAAPGSIIRTFMTTLARAEADVQTARAEAQAARDQYLRALRGATAPATTIDSATSANLVQALTKLQQVPDFGQQEALAAQLDSVVALLEDLAKAGGSSAAAREAQPAAHRANVAVAETVPPLSQALAKRGETPATGPLVLTAEHLRLELERVTRQVRIREARLNLLHQQGVAYLAEATLLRQVSTVLAEGPQRGCTPNPGKSLAETYETTFASQPVCRDRVVSALLLYADSWTLGRLPEQEIRYLLISLDHGAAIDSSEVALLQWQNLVAVPLGELVSFHRSGITSEEIGKLLEVLGLAAIAARL